MIEAARKNEIGIRKLPDKMLNDVWQNWCRSDRSAELPTPCAMTQSFTPRLLNFWEIPYHWSQSYRSSNILPFLRSRTHVVSSNMANTTLNPLIHMHCSLVLGRLEDHDNQPLLISTLPLLPQTRVSLYSLKSMWNDCAIFPPQMDNLNSGWDPLFSMWPKLWTQAFTQLLCAKL